jgi:hypothetical protein
MGSPKGAKFLSNVRKAAWVLAAATVLAPLDAAAQERFEFIPSVSMFTVYDDNLFARTAGTAGQILQVRPSFEGNFDGPRVRLLGLYSFDMQRSNHALLNTLDARRHALGETRFRATPMTTLSMAMRYDRTETPGEISIDTGILGERRQAERWQVTPSFSRRVSPMAVMTGSYDWSTEYLVDGEIGTLHVGRMGLSRDITSRMNVTAQYIGRYFLDDLTSHNSHGVMFGWSRETGPGARFSLYGGPKMRSYGGFTPEVNATFTRAALRSRFALDYWHGETIVLGIRGPVGVDSGSARISWPVSRFIELGVITGVSDINTIDGREATNYRGTLAGSWSPGGIYTVAATYGLDFQEGDIRRRLYLDGEALLVEREIRRHVFRVSITIAPRFRRSILPPDEAARAKGVSR